MQKLVFSMRDSMPQFVSCLRAIDEWKRIHAKRADAITQAEYDVNATYIKSPFARSLKIEDLLRFLDDTVLDINFMVQLPSIENCLEQWWELYAKDKSFIDQEQLRIVYYDLAFVLVEAKTETIHKNAVSMILHSSWTKWSAKEPPLSQPEFFRLLFTLSHLMTTTNRLGDYVVFFQETLAKVRRYCQSKISQAQTRKRQSRVRRKSSLAEILTKTPSGQRVFSSPNQIEQELASDAQQNGAARTILGTLSVKMDRVQTQVRATRIEDETADRFVEILDRNTRGQHVVIDPLLHEKRFQDKWKRPNGADAAFSSQELVAEQNPLTNKFYPPMFISRVRTSLPVSVPCSSSSPLSQCQSVPAIKFKSDMLVIESSKMQHDNDILRRSLSRVRLKQRIEATKANLDKNAALQEQSSKRKDQDATKPIYLAIST